MVNCTSFENSREQSLHRFESCTLRMKFEFSAGGVVFKRITNNKEQKILQILVAQHSYHHGWVFPKGLIDKDKKETKEDAALREVEEETGIVGEILKPLNPVAYWYNLDGEKIRKTVYYFLMKFKADTGKHDDEMENIEWIPQEEVMNKLTYKSDKEVWEEAEKLLTTSD